METALRNSLVFALLTISLCSASQCGQSAQKCYADQHGELSNQIRDFNFEGACNIYTSIMGCIDTIENCDDPTDQANVKAGVQNDTGSVCTSANTDIMKACQDEISKCLTDVQAIENDYMNNGAKAACPAIAKFLQCKTDLLGRGVCPDTLLKMLNTAETELKTKDLLQGCDTPCALLASKCSSVVSDTLTKTPLGQIDYKSLCTQAKESSNCINALESNGNCTSEKSLVKNMAEGVTLYVTNYCDAQGKPTECINKFTQCSNALEKQKASADPNPCKAASTFLECTNNMVCADNMKYILDKTRVNLETQETKANCPTVGSCMERFGICGAKEDLLNDLDKSKDKASYCKTIKDGFGCFDFVRKDPICVNEKTQVGAFESKVKSEYSSYCGASFIELSMLLFLAPLANILRSLL